MAKSKASANDIFSAMTQVGHVETKSEKKEITEPAEEEKTVETAAEKPQKTAKTKSRGSLEPTEKQSSKTAHRKSQTSGFRTIVSIPMDLMDDVDVASEAFGSRQAYIVSVIKRDLSENIEKYRAINEMKADL